METRGRQTASFHSLARRAWTPQYYPAAAGRLGDRANGRAARRGESVVRVGGLASESRQRLGVASSACKSLRLTRGSAATGMHRRSSRAPRRYGKPSCRTNGRRGGAVRSGAAMPSAAAMALAATARGPNRLGRRSPGGLGESEEQPEPVGRRWAGAAAAAAKSWGSESGSLWPIGGRPDGASCSRRGWSWSGPGCPLVATLTRTGTLRAGWATALGAGQRRLARCRHQPAPSLLLEAPWTRAARVRLQGPVEEAGPRRLLDRLRPAARAGERHASGAAPAG